MIQRSLYRGICWLWVLGVAAAGAAGEESRGARFQAWKAALPPAQQAWETVLEENLGSFYLPLYQDAKLTGKTTAWDYVADDPQLPRVLLIGDSISRGYTIPVRKALAGQANVHRAPANCGPTSTGLKQMDVWLGEGRWDVIHFNFGIHDRHTPPIEYAARLEKIIARLEQTGARLVWASSTPLPAGNKTYPQGACAKLNAVALPIMRRRDVAVNDLYGYILPDLQKYQTPGDCHFSGPGYEHLGSRVAQAILDELARAPQTGKPSP